MEYTGYEYPRRHQDDHKFSGQQFHEKSTDKETGLVNDLKTLALDLWIKQRKSGEPADKHVDANVEQVGFNPEPDMGKRNVVYYLTMPDGKEWMSLESEVATMTWVPMNTTIPVPLIYGFNVTYDEKENPLKTPYIFMERIQGKIFPYPFEKALGAHTRALYFDGEDKKSFKIGAIVDRNHRSYGPFSDSASYWMERAKLVLDDEKKGSKIISASNRSEDEEDDAKTAEQHLEAAVRLAEGRGKFKPAKFFLQHVDLQWQNILFDEDCNITGIIDWEWALTTALESFPLFGFNYAYKFKNRPEGCVEEHEKLALQEMQALLEKNKVKYDALANCMVELQERENASGAHDAAESHGADEVHDVAEAHDIPTQH
ncbi:hypothetical protein F5Y17DRAFT_463705 [Xylariaceae sp. FL0594]|nr:hypothetical protein F5Y17DRAFT_463705 [Xylariaceae sp. FL0594]